MAVNESVTFLQRSQTIIESIDNSIKNYGNIKSSEKSNIIKYVAELNEIIGRQNKIIIQLNSSPGVNFESFATQQNVNKKIFKRLDELKNSLATKQSSSTALKSGQQSFTEFRDKRSKNVVIIRS
jgi:hypothetical protein